MKNRLLLCLLVGFGGALLALTVCGLLLDIPASTGGARITRMNELAGLLVVSAAVYFGAVRLILRNAWPCGTVWIVLGVAVALRMLLLTVHRICVECALNMLCIFRFLVFPARLSRLLEPFSSFPCLVCLLADDSMVESAIAALNEAA